MSKPGIRTNEKPDDRTSEAAKLLRYGKYGDKICALISTKNSNSKKKKRPFVSIRLRSESKLGGHGVVKCGAGFPAYHYRHFSKAGWKACLRKTEPSHGSTGYSSEKVMS